MPSSRKLARSTGLTAARSSAYFLNYADTELDIPAAGAV